MEIYVGFIFAAVAAAIHVYIFYLESIGWTSAGALRTFGNTPEKAEITREMAFNQGFYNLFLSLWIVAGIICYASGRETIGLTLVIVGTLSMVMAGALLLATSADKRRAALIQLTPPLLALVCILIGIA